MRGERNGIKEIQSRAVCKLCVRVALRAANSREGDSAGEIYDRLIGRRTGSSGTGRHLKSKGSGARAL